MRRELITISSLFSQLGSNIVDILHAISRYQA